MKRILPILLIGLAAAVNAKSLTPSQAIDKLKKNNIPHKLARYSASDLVYTGETGDEPVFYVFGGEERDGFMILSANNDNETLIGYVDTGRFNIADMPPALNEMLHDRQTSARNTRTNLPPVAPGSVAPIAPLLSSLWNQTEPYNNLAPNFYGGPKCRAGCVPTAIAQTINYYKYPVHPEGKVEYSSVLTRYSVDFSDYTFDFDNMLDDYSAVDASVEQIKAVSELFYCCGMAMEQDWGTDVSTSSTPRIPIAMTRHFGYGDGLALVPRKNFTSEEWFNLIYGQLAAAHPVLISAKSYNPQLGHCFVCDGCDNNGYVHINWGWGGKLDGYYNLTSLYAYMPDVDAASEGYGQDQWAVINICPPALQTAPQTAIIADYIRIYESEYNAGQAINVECRHIECAGSKAKIRLGLKFEREGDGQVTYVSDEKECQYEYNTPHMDWRVALPQNLADGLYKVTPAVYNCAADRWQDINVQVGASRMYYATVDGSKITFSKPSQAVTLNLESSIIPDCYFPDKRYGATVTFSIDGADEYYGEVSAAVMSLNPDGSYRIVKESNRAVVTATCGEPCEVYVAGSLQGVSKGEYYLGFLYTDGMNSRHLGAPVPISVIEYEQGTLEVESVTILQHPTNLDPRCDLEAVFVCPDGYYSGDVLVTLEECDEYGIPINPPSRSSDFDEDNVDKLPKFPNINVGRNPVPKKISPTPPRNSLAPDAATPFPPRHGEPYRHFYPKFYASGADGEWWPLIIPGILVHLIWILSDHSGDYAIPCDAVGIPTYYNLDGVVVPASQLNEGVYIKVEKGSHDTINISKVIVR